MNILKNAYYVCFQEITYILGEREFPYKHHSITAGGRANRMIRTVCLPANANQFNPVAHFENGVLTVAFPKLNIDAVPQKIPVIP
jgi:HSP20 family molecular chaperone IbpA